MPYTRPAVYLERTDAARNEPIVLRTDVTGFVGIARRGPLDTPVPVESFRQFTAQFGEPTAAGYLAYAVRGFFENGGRRCWVVRVASRDAAGGAVEASAVVSDDAAVPVFRLTASSPGTWGNSLSFEWATEVAGATTTIPGRSAPQYATVGSTSGFSRATLVRIERPGQPPVYRVVAAVDHDQRRLYWVHPDRRSALPTDRPLSGLPLEQPLRLVPVTYSLTVREAGVLRTRYRDLQLVPSHDRYVPRVLAAAPSTTALAATEPWLPPTQVPRAPEAVVAEALIEDTAAIPRPLAFTPGALELLSSGRDGLVTLIARDFLGEPEAAEDSDFVRARKRRGLQALSWVDEVALVAIPDILIRPEPDPAYEPVPLPPPDPCLDCPAPAPRRTVHQPVPAGELPPAFDDGAIAQVQSALLEECERRGDRFALLSLPFQLATAAASSRDDAIAWRRLFETRYGALYAPWVQVLDPRRTGATRLVPACGHVAGAIARTDLSQGVYRAPANTTLEGVTDLSRVFDDRDHGELNDAGLNVLRAEFGRPPLVAGARTLSHDPDWRYVNVVRLVLALKKAIDLALRWVVFEPNDAATRSQAAAALGGLLRALWERGAFKGRTPEEGFFVRCDEVTTAAADRDQGRLIARVGVAPAAPCEFIVLRVGREANSIAVTLVPDPEGRP